MSPHLSLHTSFDHPQSSRRQPPPQDRPYNNSNSNTTSPTSSPTSPGSITAITTTTTNNHTNPLRRCLFHPHQRPFSAIEPTTPPLSSSGSRSPSRSSVLLRRRPSKIDMALSAERSRYDCDAIERQGLDLMEPRPVDPAFAFEPLTLGLGCACEDAWAASGAGCRLSGASASGYSESRSSCSSYTREGRMTQPKFVMGGIFEVMEGRA